MARWGMLHDVVRERGRALSATLAIVVWVAASLGAMLLARHDWVWLTVSLVGAALVLAAPPLRPFRRAFAFIAIGLLAGLFALEAGVRLRAFGPDALARFSAYSPSGLAAHLLRPRDEGGLMYGTIPGHQSRFMGHDLRFNSLGCRGPELPATRPELPAARPELPTARPELPATRPDGHFLIVATGTSVTMGAGVSETEAFAPLAGARLSAETGIPVDVLNCGTPSYALPLVLRHAEYMARLVRPDAVLVEVHPSALNAPQDVEAIAALLRRGPSAEAVTSDIERLSFAATALYPPADLRKRVEGFLPWRKASPAPASATRPQHLDDLDAQMRALAHLGREQGFGVYAFFLRIMSDFAKPDANAASRERFRRVCEEAGVEIIDVYPAFRPHEFSDEFIVFPGDLHPNARAHARFADAVASALRPKLAARKAAPTPP